MGRYGDQERGRGGWSADVKEADNGVGGCGRGQSWGVWGEQHTVSAAVDWDRGE